MSSSWEFSRISLWTCSIGFASPSPVAFENFPTVPFGSTTSTTILHGILTGIIFDNLSEVPSGNLQEIYFDYLQEFLKISD